MLDAHIQELGRELDMQDLIQKPETGHYVIPLQDEIQVNVKLADQSYIMQALVANSPSTNSEAFINKIMQANLFGRGTRGAALGLNEEGTQFILTQEVDSHNTYRDFKEKLEDFITIVDFWRNEALNHR